MKIVHAKTNVKSGKKNVFAAGNVFEDMDETTFEGPDLQDADVDDIQGDMGEEGQQDGTTIDIDNNIVNHLIAECENCHGIFISAMLASDQTIESINGVCPLCSKDTEQSLKWIIKDYPEK